MSDPMRSAAEPTTCTVLGRTLRYRRMRVNAPDKVGIEVQDWASAAFPTAELLLIHGFSQSHGAFLKQVASPLAHSFRLVTYDLRGHGGSDKPAEASYYREPSRWAGEVNAVMQQAQLRRPFLLAWSYGGRVALDYLGQHGDSGISGLIMVNATAKASPDVLGPAIGVLKQMTSPDAPVALAGTRSLLEECAARPLPAAELDYMLDYNLQVPAPIRAHLAGRPADYEATLKALKVPVLIVHGMRDRINQESMATYTAQQVPHAHLLRYEDAGHMPFWESADRFNEDLANFMRAVTR